MSRIIFGIVIALAVVMCAGTAAVVGGLFAGGKAVIEIQGNPAKVSHAAGKIADFTLPAGYSEDYAVDKLGMTVAAYKGNDGHSHLMLSQSPKALNIGQGDSKKPAVGDYDKTTRLEVVETRVMTVRGQETTVVISEARNSDGMPYRQLSAAFQGKGGPALLVIDEPTSRWDQDQIDQFIASIQ